jgi:hypothetical protein
MLVLALAWRLAAAHGGIPSSLPATRFTLTGDAGVFVQANSTTPFAVSPDGRTIVFRAWTDTTPPQLWVRTLGEAEARPIPGTEGGINPAISPDGARVAFVGLEGRTLFTVGVGGGDVGTLAKLDGWTAALSWASNHEIVFESAEPAPGIHRVDATGGKPELVIPLDSATAEIRQRSPLALGTSGVVVYASWVKGQDEPSLVLDRLSDGRRVRLGIPGNHPVAFIDGHMVYTRTDGSLISVLCGRRDSRSLWSRASRAAAPEPPWVSPPPARSSTALPM